MVFALLVASVLAQSNPTVRDCVSEKMVDELDALETRSVEIQQSLLDFNGSGQLSDFDHQLSASIVGVLGTFDEQILHSLSLVKILVISTGKSRDSAVALWANLLRRIVPSMGAATKFLAQTAAGMKSPALAQEALRAKSLVSDAAKILKQCPSQSREALPVGR